MSKFFKVWLKTRGGRIRAYFIAEGRNITQFLFDKLPYGVKVVKCQEISEKQFEKLGKSKFNYKNLEDIYSENICNRA